MKKHPPRSSETEKKKRVAVAVLAVVFVITAYVTFFKGKPAVAPTAQVPGTQQDAVSPAEARVRAPARAEKTEAPVLSLSSVKEPDIVFQKTIRDIFRPPVSSAGKKPETAAGKASPPPLSREEIAEIKTRIQFKGAILYGQKAVAIINDAFFHAGESIGPYRIVSISEKTVRIDTGRGKINLEMIHDD